MHVYCTHNCTLVFFFISSRTLGHSTLPLPTNLLPILFLSHSMKMLVSNLKPRGNMPRPWIRIDEGTEQIIGFVICATTEMSRKIEQC